MAYKFETQYNSPNYTPHSQVVAVFGLARDYATTEHWWGEPDTGMTYEGVISWLCRPGGNTSAHIVVDGPTRRVACIITTENNTMVRYYSAKYTDEPNSAYLTWAYRTRLPNWFQPNDCIDLRPT